MKTIPLLLLCIITLFMALPSSVSGQVPWRFRHQGYLTTPPGIPIKGTVEMTFSLYTAEDATSAIWDETHVAVMVTDGAYSILPGSVDPEGKALNPSLFSQPLWLGVTVDGEDVLPRQQIRSVIRLELMRRILLNAHEGVRSPRFRQR